MESPVSLSHPDAVRDAVWRFWAEKYRGKDLSSQADKSDTRLNDALAQRKKSVDCVLGVIDLQDVAGEWVLSIQCKENLVHRLHRALNARDDDWLVFKCHGCGYSFE